MLLCSYLIVLIFLPHMLLCSYLVLLISYSAHILPPVLLWSHTVLLIFESQMLLCSYLILFIFCLICYSGHILFCSYLSLKCYSAHILFCSYFVRLISYSVSVDYIIFCNFMLELSLFLPMYLSLLIFVACSPLS